MTSTIVNDIHSRLNETTVSKIVRPRSVADVQDAVRRTPGPRRWQHGDSRRLPFHGRPAVPHRGNPARHAVDAPNHSESILDRGIVDVEAGILWSDLVPRLRAMQGDGGPKWSIVQKQTGADRLSVGGALAANGHGRGLQFQPIVQDVESFTLVDSKGPVRECSRSTNTDLFGAAIGGYGLFGVITSVRLRLQPWHRLERVVEVFDIEGLPDAFQSRIDDGFTYGDFQYMTDESSEDFLRRGVFSCYRPTDDAPPSSDSART